MVKLKRLIPGSNTSLSAVLDAEGKVITDPGQMATALIAHWEEVFTQREVDTTLLDKWHRELPVPQSPLNTGISTAVGGKGSKRDKDSGRGLKTNGNKGKEAEGSRRSAEYDNQRRKEGAERRTKPSNARIGRRQDAVRTAKRSCTASPRICPLSRRNAKKSHRP